ncbi:hypothetical protein O0544_10205 [Edwardsiella anguillarum]|nr:hypothetical protein [Edwardsiella anguillarum]
MRLLRRENRNYNLVALLGGAVSGTLTAALLSWEPCAPDGRCPPGRR